MWVFGLRRVVSSHLRRFLCIAAGEVSSIIACSGYASRLIEKLQNVSIAFDGGGVRDTVPSLFILVMRTTVRATARYDIGMVVRRFSAGFSATIRRRRILSASKPPAGRADFLTIIGGAGYAPAIHSRHAAAVCRTGGSPVPACTSRCRPAGAD